MESTISNLASGLNPEATSQLAGQSSFDQNTEQMQETSDVKSENIGGTLEVIDASKVVTSGDSKENSEPNESEKKSELENSIDIFDGTKTVKYSSDEEVNSDVSDTGAETDLEENLNGSSESRAVDNASAEDSDSGTSSSNEDNDSSSDADSDDDSDGSDIEDVNLEDEINEGDDDEPIKSKNEIIDFKVPSLPSDYVIDASTQIYPVGTITGIVDKTVLIKAYGSGEDKVLKDGTVFCFEDRAPLGLLYEVIGRLQAPIYTIKFNTQEEAQNFEDKKGSKVYFVASTAEFLNTRYIKSLKGTDASNCNDEELPEEEQEFSDDEKEAEAKRNKKQKKKQSAIKNSSENVIDVPAQIETEASHDNVVPAIPTAPKVMEEHLSKKQKLNGSIPQQQPKTVPISVKARLTSLPSKKKAGEPQVKSTASSVPPTSADPMAMMQQFMGMMQQAASVAQSAPQSFNGQQPGYGQQYNPGYNPAPFYPGYSQPHYQQQFGQNYNQYQNYNQPQNTQFNAHNNVQYLPQHQGQFGMQYPGNYNGQFLQPHSSPQAPASAPQLTNSGYAHQQVNSPSQFQHTAATPVSSSASQTQDTSLLVAQIAAAISKNASDAAARIKSMNHESFAASGTDPSLPNNEEEEGEDDDYDPEI